MLYFSQKNFARLHFYAEQHYYESESIAFFVPYNQWITIQFTMT